MVIIFQFLRQLSLEEPNKSFHDFHDKASSIDITFFVFNLNNYLNKCTTYVLNMAEDKFIF